MTDSTINNLIIGIPTIIGALGSFIAILRVNKKQNDANIKQDVANQKLDVAAEKRDQNNDKITEIHTSTNGTLSKLEQQVATSAEEIKGLKALIEQMNKDKK